jgi:archaellum component FlaC
VFFTLKSKVDNLSKDFETLSKDSLHRLHKRIDALEDRDAKFNEVLTGINEKLIVLNERLSALQRLEETIKELQKSRGGGVI